jgi:hypothetical protein
MNVIFGLFCLFAIFLDLNKIEGEVLIMVFLNRHGARTSIHEFTELEEIFPDYQKGVLTYNGWREQIILGKYVRNKYLTSNKHGLKSEPYLKINNPSKEFLILSSPLSRTLESSFAYSTGLFPDHFYNLINPGGVTDNDKDSDILPIKNFNPNAILKDTNTFNIMVSDMNRDILFHGKRCKVHKDKSEKEEISLINEAEKKILYDYLKKTFPITLKDIEFDNLDSTLIKYLNSAIVCVNANFDIEIFKMPKEVRDIFSKMVVNYIYLKKFKNLDTNRLISSQFFDEIAKMFDFKTGNGERKLNFFNHTNIEYDDLKLAVFSGHDTNILAALNNLIREEILISLLKNPIDNVDFLVPKFSSSLEFHLIKKRNKHYVKLFYNGMDISDKIQNSNGREIEYQKFKDLLISKIFPDYQNCQYKILNKDED